PYAFQYERYWLQSAPSQVAVGDSWRYRITWKPVPLPVEPGGPVLAGRWLVVADAGADVADLTKVWEAAGAQVVAVEVAADEERAGLAARLPQAEAEGVVGVVSLLSSAAATLVLIQALGDAGVEAPLWCVTRGAVSAARDDGAADPALAMIWGLGRVAALEHPERWGGLVDLPTEAGGADWGRLGSVLPQASGAGEDQLALRDSGVFGRRLVRAPLGGRRPVRDWSSSGTVLVTGGTGALGGKVARWAAEQGAEHVVLVSRSGADAPGADRLVQDLAERGTRVTVTACDVADREAMARVLAAVPEDAPLTAVFHTAGTPGGLSLDATGPEDVRRTLRAKTEGAQVLDELLRGTPLDAFVLYSSNAGVWGSGSQGVYAAANAYLDALAARRRARGETATSVAWGLWAGDGMGEGADDTYWQRRGIRPMHDERALEELRKALEHDETFVAVADVDWKTFAPAFTVSRPSVLVEDVPEARQALAAPEAPASDAPGGPGTPSALAAVAALPAAERERALVDLVLTHAAVVLGHSSPDRLTGDRAFMEIGFDSLTAVQLRNRLSTAIGTTLPTTVVFDYPTPAALAAHLLQEHVAPPTIAPTDWEGQVRQALAELPLDRLREAALLDDLLRLIGVGPEPAPGSPDAPAADAHAGDGGTTAPEASIDDLDTDDLVRMALGLSQS
ncbi:beta-ketoacyl reductase, partial [Streptomyces sp. RY43-2]